MSTICVPVETKLFVELSQLLAKHQSTLGPVEAVSTAIGYWLDNAEWKAADLIPQPVGQGYQWKGVHLPAGTLLRIRVGRGYQYATVENDYPVYKNERHSPNQFAKAATGSERDAWRDLWVKRPSDDDYLPADDLRKGLA